MTTFGKNKLAIYCLNIKATKMPELVNLLRKNTHFKESTVKLLEVSTIWLTICKYVRNVHDDLDITLKYLLLHKNPNTK